MPEPIIDSDFESVVDELTQLVDSDSNVYDQLLSRLIDSSLLNSGGFLSKQALKDLLQNVIFPTNFTYGVGWQEETDSLVSLDQPRGSMNGVTAELLEQYFDVIFTQSQIPEVVSLSQQINQRQWRETEELKKQLLYSLCISAAASSLFYVALAGSFECNYALRIMTADPCAGYLLAQFAFDTHPQNGDFFIKNNLQQVPTPSGEVGLFYPDQFASMWVRSAELIKQGGGAAYTIGAIKARDQWLISSTTPVDTNPLGQYQEVWRSQLMADPSPGHLGTVVKINEEFNLNTKSYFTFSNPGEADSLQQIGNSYVEAINQAGFDYDALAAGVSIDLLDPITTPLPSGSLVEQTLPNVSGSNPITSGSVRPSTSGTQAKNARLDQLLSIRTSNGGKVNNYGGSQVIINSDRVILNSRTDYLMMFGGAGVSIASPNPVNIESDTTVTLYGEEGVYLGLPNKGESYNLNSPPIPTNKAQATPNQEYEPLVLGSKLVEILEDLILTLRNAAVLTPTGTGFLKEDTLYQLACLQARLPEMKSTFAFVDGISHEQPQPEPSAPSTTATTTNQQSPTQATANVVQGSSNVDVPLVNQFNDFYDTNTLYDDPIA